VFGLDLDLDLDKLVLDLNLEVENLYKFEVLKFIFDHYVSVRQI
jgi:hypothetical protein